MSGKNDKINGSQKFIENYTGDFGKAAEFMFVLIMCILPVYMTGDKYEGLTSAKTQFFYFSVFTSVVVLIVVMLCYMGNLNKWQIVNKALRINAIDIAVLCYIAVVIISSCLAKDKTTAFFGIKERNDGVFTQLCYVIVYFILSRYYIMKERDMRLFAGISIVISLIGIIQFNGYNIFHLFPYEIPEVTAKFGNNGYNIIFRTTFGNINIVSTFVCVALIICSVLYVKIDTRWRFLYLAAAALGVYMLMVADSDSGKVGFAATVVLLIPFWTQNKKSIKRTAALAVSFAVLLFLYALSYFVIGLKTMTLDALFGSIWAILVIVTVIALGIILLVCKYINIKISVKNVRILGVVLIIGFILGGLGGLEVLGSRYESGTIHEMREVMHGSMSDEFGSNRGYIWKKSIEVAKKNPLIGTGQDSLYEAFTDYHKESMALFGQVFDKAHNEYLQILVCTGFIGLFAYLVFLVLNFIKVLKHAWESSLVMAVTAGALAYSAQAFFNIGLPITGPLLWVCIGMMSSVIRRGEAEKKIAK